VSDLLCSVEAHGKALGFSFSLPDYGPILSGMRGRFAFIKALRFKQLARSIHRLRALGFQIHKAYQGRGIETFLYMDTMGAAKRLGSKENIVLALEKYRINEQ